LNGLRSNFTPAGVIHVNDFNPELSINPVDELQAVHSLKSVD
jgi:hypothetical protein